MQALVQANPSLDLSEDGFVVDLTAFNGEQSRLVMAAPNDDFYILIFQKQGRTLAAYATSIAYVTQSENP